MNNQESLLLNEVEKLRIENGLLLKGANMQSLCIEMKDQAIELLNQHADYLRCVSDWYNKFEGIPAEYKQIDQQHKEQFIDTLEDFKQCMAKIETERAEQNRLLCSNYSYSVLMKNEPDTEIN